jgi:hypothetical protein
MTDIVERLRTEGALAGHYDTPAIQRQAADEIERLQAGLLRVMQYEQKCDQTGQPCRSPDRCACSLEAETWCEDTNEANDG